jgi:hypothetical protein
VRWDIEFKRRGGGYINLLSVGCPYCAHGAHSGAQTAVLRLGWAEGVENLGSWNSRLFPLRQNCLLAIRRCAAFRTLQQVLLDYCAWRRDLNMR